MSTKFKNSPIFLCGFMSAGKSTSGKILAGMLGYAFADTDGEISRQHGISVPDFISQNGFKKFRREERRILRHLSSRKKIVISCGGGLYPTSATADFFSKGISIFLDLPEEILAERISKNLSAYPKFAKISSKNELGKGIRALLLRRIKFYEKCDLRYSPRNSSPEQATAEIAEMIMFL